MATESTVSAPGFLERRFRPSARGTNPRRELVAGLTTFMTMAYILFVNPSILGTGEQGLPFAAVLSVTALVAGVMTIAMGVVANYPFAIAAGLGLNAVVAFQLVGAEGLSYPEERGVVVTEGLLITVLVLTGFREAVLDAIPVELKKAIGAGIGLFIAIIGFQRHRRRWPDGPDRGGHRCAVPAGDVLLTTGWRDPPGGDGPHADRGRLPDALGRSRGALG